MSLSPEGYQEKKCSSYGIYGEDIIFKPVTEEKRIHIEKPKIHNTQQSKDLSNYIYENLEKIDVLEKKLIVKFILSVVFTYIVLTLSFYLFFISHEERKIEDTGYILIDSDGDGIDEIHTAEGNAYNKPLQSSLIAALFFMLIGKLVFYPMNRIKAKYSIYEGYCKALKDIVINDIHT